MKALSCTLSTATGVKLNLIDAPNEKPDNLSNPLDLVSPFISATPIPVKVTAGERMGDGTDHT